MLCLSLERPSEPVKSISAKEAEARKRKIARLKMAVSNGTYRIDSRKLAEKVIVNSLIESTLLSAVDTLDEEAGKDRAS